MSEDYKGNSIPSYGDAADGPASFKTFIDSGPIPRFADASARDAAIATPAQGQLCYVTSLAELQLYDGATWGTPFVDIAGDTMSGDLDMNTNRVMNLPNPVADGDAVPRVWVDTNYAAGSHPHDGGDINTGVISAAHLPIGTLANEVAEGDHTHTGATISGLDGGDITTGIVASARTTQATTSVRGTVQLNDTHTSTSATQAPTMALTNGKLKAHTGTGSEIIVSAGDPTGGQNGDIWLKV